MDKGVGCMKIGCAYMTFYGMEFITKSIIAHRKIFDYICVVHQTKGVFCDDNDGGMIVLLQHLRHKNLIDNFVVYNNDKNKPIECYILDKRNIGLKMCVDANCDYIIPLDSDEIYTKELLEEIKKIQPLILFIVQLELIM